MQVDRTLGWWMVAVRGRQSQSRRGLSHSVRHTLRIRTAKIYGPYVLSVPLFLCTSVSHEDEVSFWSCAVEAQKPAMICGERRAGAF